MRYSVCLIILLTTGAVGWQTELDSLLGMPPGIEREELLMKVVARAPDWREVVTRIESVQFQDVEKGVMLVHHSMCEDGIERPWVIYVPSGYDPGKPTPLLIMLHGGVSRKDLIEDPKTWAEGIEFTGLAEERGWLVLCPMGQEGATWWDEVGMHNIRDLIRTVKSRYNVDDDRVWMEGFSDGGSAAFLHAMVAPTDYAAFVALNGHMGVGSLDGDLPTFAPNFYNTPVYAVTTDQDEIYPAHKMRILIDMARRAGGHILYREHDGGHEPSYAAVEYPLIALFLERHVRDPLPTRIVWEAAEPEFGLCRWFAIDQITTGEPAQWHVDHNASLVDDRVIIGFLADDSYEGKGVKVGKIFEETAAEDLKMESGDIIVRGGKKEITSMEDLGDFKAGLKRGDPIELTVKRGDEEIRLKGRLPEPANYYVFKRDKPSALARVSFSANRVDIDASRVRAFRILVHPSLIRVEQNLMVRVNGEAVYDGRVEPSLEYLLRNFLENRDRRLLYVAEVKVQL